MPVLGDATTRRGGKPMDASVKSKRDRILWIGIRSPQIGSELMSQ